MYQRNRNGDRKKALEKKLIEVEEETTEVKEERIENLVSEIGSLKFEKDKRIYENMELDAARDDFLKHDWR